MGGIKRVSGEKRCQEGHRGGGGGDRGWREGHGSLCPCSVPCPCPRPRAVPRVAVLRWELPQFSSRGRELLGRGSMARRHLRAAGFLLAEVSGDGMGWD